MNGNGKLKAGRSKDRLAGACPGVDAPKRKNAHACDYFTSKGHHIQKKDSLSAPLQHSFSPREKIAAQRLTQQGRAAARPDYSRGEEEERRKRGASG